MFSKTKLSIVLLFSLHCITWAGLTVSKSKAQVLKSKKGALIHVINYVLSDRSLNFIKVMLPNKKEYTLPQTVSASGSIYTDGFHIKFCSKGDRTDIYELDENGKWQKLFEDCVPVSKK